MKRLVRSFFNSDSVALAYPVVVKHTAGKCCPSTFFLPQVEARGKIGMRKQGFDEKFAIEGFMVKESMPPQISARPYNMELMVQQIAKKKEEEEEEPP